MVVIKSAPSNQAVLTQNAMTILNKRYLDGGTVDQMWDRVSGGNPVFRNLLSSLRFLPNSPTLFNMGKNNGCTSSACFTFEVDDCMKYNSDGTINENSIVRTREKAIDVAKSGGGVGYYLGDLRAKGSPIKSIHRKACGPIAVLRDYHGISHLITQGGKRELAQMAVLPCDHEDIQDFIHCKDRDPQGLGSFNISVSWYNKWLDSVDRNKPIDGQTINGPTRIWWDQCESAWEHGCPGMFFPDVINRFNTNPHLGLIKTPNPCAEAFNRNNGVCSLGSLSLVRYFSPGNRSVDWKLLEEDAWNSTLLLDDILDRNVFPHPDITKAAYLTRRLGLGVMGWADLLALMHIHYDSQKAIDLGEQIMKLINDVARAASEHLATEKGPYTGYDPDRTRDTCRRNETNTSIAPTGTIAIIAGVWGSIEPHFALRCERTTAEGIKMQDGIQDWIWNQLDGFVPKVASEIDYTWHIKHQAAFQKYVDLGCSKTINLPKSATVEDVSNCYRMLYETGCKGGTIFRDGCRDEQVLVKEKTKSVFQVNTNPPEEFVRMSKDEILNTVRVDPSLTPPKPKRRKLPDEVPGSRIKIKVDGFKGYLHWGLFEDGTLAEIFIRSSKNGSTINGLIDAWAITFSMALQHGVPVEDLCRMLQGARFEPAGITGNKDVPMCTSIIDFVAKWLYKRFVVAPSLSNSTPLVTIAGEVTHPEVNGKHKPVRSGQLCPECGNEMIYSGGCLLCTDSSCGYSKCG